MAFCLLAGVSEALAETYVVGVEKLQYAPHYYVENGVYKGYARDVLDAFAEHTGHRLIYKPIPVARLWYAYFDGTVDFKYPDSPHWNTSKKVDHDVRYSAPVVEYIDGTIVRADKRGQGLEAFTTLGIVRGFTPEPYTEAILAGDVVVRSNTSYIALLRQLKQDRLDGVYGNVTTTLHITSQNSKFGDLVFDPSLPFRRSHFLLSTIRHPQVIESFNRFLQEHGPLIESLKAKHKVERFSSD